MDEMQPAARRDAIIPAQAPIEAAVVPPGAVPYVDPQAAMGPATPPQGTPYQPIYVTQQVQMAPAYVVAVPQKSMLAAVLLSVFFGPLGMLYVTVPGAIIMFIVSIVLALFTLGFSVLVTWPVCVIWAAIATNNYNMKLTGSAPNYSQNVR